LTTQEPNLEIEIPNENMELPPVDAPNLNPADLMEEAKRAPNAPEEKQVFNPTQPQTRGGEGNLNIPVTVARR
jgi:hypothetical protein